MYLLGMLEIIRSIIKGLNDIISELIDGKCFIQIIQLVIDARLLVYVQLGYNQS